MAQTVAFYCPMKSPWHPVPSGDRLIARLLIKALEADGYDVDLVSERRSWFATADTQQLEAMQRQSRDDAASYIASINGGARQRPAFWLTYHNYYRAPDLLGPPVCDALDVHYSIAEASHSPRRLTGEWQRFADASFSALKRADSLVQLNPLDGPMIEQALDPLPPRLELPPFLGAERLPSIDRDHRERQCDRWPLDASKPILLTVAMMRRGDKLASYQRLAAALEWLDRADLQVLLIGDGEARPAVEAAMARLANPVCFAGRCDADAIADALQHADIFAWPAVNEAFGMAMLEAQAHGLPVVAGASDGVALVVEHQRSGLLVEAQREATFVERFAAAIATLLDDQALRRSFGDAARRRVAADQLLPMAAARLGEFYRGRVQ
ncbi:glycosyltransferase family 4 protein [Gammaproteobacteria bacterium]|nr:glycosyltransferase family 4 protein [Gammaproteobacteria bacterium]